MKKRYALQVSDLHCGHKLGLCNPDVQLQDEGPDGNLYWYTPALTQTQKYLWEVFKNGIESALDIAGKNEVVVFVTGDVTNGDKYPEGLMPVRKEDQNTIAVSCLKELCELQNVKTVRLSKGTGSHEFGEGSSTVAMENRLSALFPKKDIRSLYHGYADMDGITIDYAHHGPYPGSRVWLKGNVTRYYLKDLMMSDALMGKKPPRIVMRSHYHEYIRETYRLNTELWGEVESDLIISPSLCGLTDFSRQATRSTPRVTNGMVLYEMVDGKLVEIYPLITVQDLRTKEEI